MSPLTCHDHREPHGHFNDLPSNRHCELQAAGRQRDSYGNQAEPTAFVPAPEQATNPPK